MAVLGLRLTVVLGLAALFGETLGIIYITPGPRNISVNPGDNVSFHCKASGYPQPIYVKWTRGGQMILGRSTKHTLYSNGTLIISNAQSNDQGTYICTAANSDSITNPWAFELSIKGNPSGNTPPNYGRIEGNVKAKIWGHARTFMEGGHFKLTCEGTGNPAPKVEWFKDEQKILNDNRRAIQFGTLTVFSASSKDEGFYTCKATNIWDSDSDSRFVLMKQHSNPSGNTPPNYGRVKGNVKVKIKGPSTFMEGDNIKLICDATGNPAPKVEWFKEKQKILNAYRRSVQSGALTVFSASSKDEGTYTCKATNNLDSDSDSRFVLMKQHSNPSGKTPPNDNRVTGTIKPIITGLRNYTEGEPIRLDCNPQPWVEWLKGKRIFRTDNNRTTVRNGVLTIASASKEDEGIYTCNAHNSMAKGTTSTFVQIKAKNCTIDRYGPKCNKECHCHGQDCGSTDHVNCIHGCKVGWMGKSCDKPREDAAVSFFCVNSPSLGKYAHIRIDTKGIKYDKINATDSKGTLVSWCKTTKIDTSKVPNTTTIKIPIDKGKCAGGEKTKADHYKWRIKIQEYPVITSMNDQEVEVECDFTTANSFSLSTKTKIDAGKQSSGKKPVKKAVNLKPKNKKLVLELVDPATGKKVSQPVAESPVMLKISDTTPKGNATSGIKPFNCEAKPPAGKPIIKLTDQDGCPGSPGLEFSRNGTQSILTKPFRAFRVLFNIPGVDFSCSYIPCFDKNDCRVDCHHALKNGTRSRVGRSAGFPEKRLTTGIVEVVWSNDDALPGQAEDVPKQMMLKDDSSSANGLMPCSTLTVFVAMVTAVAITARFRGLCGRQN